MRAFAWLRGVWEGLTAPKVVDATRFEYRGVALDRADVEQVDRAVLPGGARFVRVTMRSGAIVELRAPDREAFLAWWRSPEE